MQKNGQPSFKKNAAWLGMSQGAKILVQLVGMVFLARFLDAHDYGVMALAAVATNLGGLFRDLGTGPAVIREKDLKIEMINSVFWMNIISGLVVALLIIGTASALADAFSSPVLKYVLYGLSLTFPIMSYGAVHQSLLERASKFNLIGRSDVVSYTTGMVAAIVSAFYGLGPYSFVVQALVHSSLSSFQMVRLSNWKPSAGIDLFQVKRIMSFSSSITLSNFVQYLVKNLDATIVGKTLGSVQLGVYSMAFKVMLYPLQNVALVASKALFPILSLQQDSRAKQSDSYIGSLGIVALLVAPLMGGVMAVREPFVAVVFGSKWAAVADVIFWLAPVGFIQSVLSTVPTVMMANGRSWLLLGVNAFSVIVHVVAWVIGAQYALAGVSAGYLAASTIVLFVNTYLVAEILDSSLLKLLKVIASPVCAMIGVFAAATFVLNASKSASHGDVFVLVLSVLAGGGYFFVHVLIFHRKHLMPFVKKLPFGARFK